MTCALDRVMLVVNCCMKLHNLCRNHSIQMRSPLAACNFGLGKTQGDCQPKDHNPMSKPDTPCAANEFIANDLVHVQLENRHRGREASTRRDHLARALKDGGFMRPGYSTYSVA